MSQDLPEFEARNVKDVQPFVHSIFGNNLEDLIVYEDGHFRAIFAETQFTLTEDKPEPSKSQWSTLKKKFKRRDSSAFVFRKTGKAQCSEASDEAKQCYYIDFGFFLY